MTLADRSPVAVWAELRSTALIGTARRRVPEPIELDGVVLDRSEAAGASDVEPPVQLAVELAGSAAAVLDAAALGVVGRRAGQRAATGAVVPEPAPADRRTEAPATASHLLELLLGPNPPAAAHRSELLVHWCARCAAADRRVPSRLLVGLLDHATGASPLRVPVARVVDERGRWLAAANPAWSWADHAATSGDPLAASGAVDADEWPRLPSAERLATLTEVRAADPDAARRLLRSTWSSDSAATRAAHLGVLRLRPDPGDAELLEAALDDRAASVRQQALAVLDGIPTSARARRMADRLAPLVHVEGKRRKRTVEIDLPDDPDAGGTRDGLVTPPAGRSARGWWLEQLAAGAPLELWTDATGEDIETTWALVTDPDARAGLIRAILARRDGAWAAVAFGSGADPRLLAAVDPARRVELVSEVLRSRQRPNSMRLTALVGHVPGPWSLPFSTLVLESIRADGAPVTALQHAGSILATGLHPDSQAFLERWLAGLEEQPHVAAALRVLIQFQSLHRSITEAFS